MLNKTTIDQIIKLNQANPFAPIYVIVQDKLLIEEAFLKATPSLFNLEIITYNELLRLLLNLYGLNRLKLINPDEGILFLKEYLDQQNFTCFKNCSLATIGQLWDFVKQADHYQSPFCFDRLGPLATIKLGEFQKIVAACATLVDATSRLSYEKDLLALVDEKIKSWQLFFVLDDYTPLQEQLIESLAAKAKVTRLGFGSMAKSPLAMHLEAHFFQDDQKYPGPTPYCRLDLGVDTMQYTQVASAIYLALKNKRRTYRDFAIVTNNPADKEKMSQVLDQFAIPHNGPTKVKNNSYLAVLALKKHLLNHDGLALLSFLTNPVIKSDFGQFDLLTYKKTSQMPRHILSDFTLSPAAPLDQYATNLAALMTKHFVFSPQSQEIISQLNNLTRFKTTLTLADFFDLLLAKIAPRDEFAQLLNDHVYLLDLASPWLEILDIKEVYVLSATEDVFPKKIKNNLVLLDDELKVLKLPTIKDRLEKENQLILKLFASKVDKMFICCPLFNLKSEALLLSSLVKNLFKRYPWQQEPLITGLAHFQLAHQLYLHQTFLQEKSAINQVIDCYQSHANQPEAIAAGLPAPKLSPSQIEAYNSCPFKYFLSYHARLQPLRESKLQANQTGSLIHYLIEQSQQFIEDYDFAPLAEHLEKLTGQFVKDNQIALTSTNRLLLKRIKEDMVVTLAILSRQYRLSASTIGATEQYVSLENPGLNLHGKIDRVNFSHDYVAVMDYKGSAKKLDEKYLVLGVNIQMLVYLHMIAKQTKRKPGGVFYFNYAPATLKSTAPINTETFDWTSLLKEKRMVALMDEDFADFLEDVAGGEEAQSFVAKKNKNGSWASSTPVISAAELDLLINEIISYIEKLNHNLVAGNIAIAPIVSDIEDKAMLKPCTYCDYKAICKFDPFYNEYRNLAKEVKANESK